MSQEIAAALQSDIDASDEFPALRPKLAHYTSIATAQKILESKELWFSNPLFMNDLEELRFGLLLARDMLLVDQGLRSAWGSHHSAFIDAFMAAFAEIENGEALEFFIFCLSEHDEQDDDGLLSMWRGYGANGGGTALVFDTAKLQGNVTGTPIILAKVRYLTTAQRKDWIAGRLTLLAAAIRKLGPRPDLVSGVATILLRRFVLAALYSKHKGFHEEREWRVTYVPYLDQQKRLGPQKRYVVGRRIVEPRLVYTPGLFGDLDGAPDLDQVLCKIILGPTVSSVISQHTFRGLLDQLRPGLSQLVCVSTTPYRSLD